MNDIKVNLYSYNIDNINELLKRIYGFEIDFDISKMILQDKYFAYYDYNTPFHKIMTVHSSKGLEADEVYVKK